MPPAFKPLPPPSSWPLPTLSLRIPDLAHPGASAFLSAVNPSDALTSAVLYSFNLLYDTPSNPATPQHVGSIMLVLRSMPGVAYTTGGEGGNAFKEIHVSLEYIQDKAKNGVEALRHEINGVLTHEVVHCYQYNAKGTCPGGLIEGIADFVRLHASLAPPHWKRDNIPDKWDAGYQSTAYFLDWLEERYGAGTIRELNATMRDQEWTDRIFKELTGRKLEKLWRIYHGELERRRAL
ncbi:hypothetical protein CPB85DRAFT_1464205 [Mucidula mucida]|nr:hypothetical protein CPB85DRAFT_1464205 [Mucidula mucida]